MNSLCYLTKINFFLGKTHGIIVPLVICLSEFYLKSHLCGTKNSYVQIQIHGWNYRHNYALCIMNTNYEYTLKGDHKGSPLRSNPTDGFLHNYALRIMNYELMLCGFKEGVSIF